jgi:membrane protease YdiL (CAAX protease family)
MSIYPEPGAQGPSLTESAPPPPPTLEPAPRRLPHLGHAFLFIVTAAGILLGAQIILMLLGKSPASHQGNGTLEHPMLQMLSLGVTYVLTLAISWLVFPSIWNRTFLEGIRWNWYTARVHAPKLVVLGLTLGLMMQVLTYFITPPKSLPIDQFFATPLDAWVMTFFGILIAPAFEEICFRGFLVPAFAIAYDYLTLKRSPEAELHWRTTTVLSPVSLLFSAVATSILFAWMHAQQIAHLWAALVGLFSVSLLLTMVRVRTHSVAASTVVHAAYNSFIFIAVLIQTGGYRHLDRLAR